MVPDAGLASEVDSISHRGNRARKPTIIKSHVKSVERWQARQGNWSGKEVCMGRKASNQSAVKERLIHLLMGVGVHNSHAPLARAAKWGN